MNQLIIWVAAIIFVEAVVEIEVESEIFMIIRDKLSRLKFFGWYLNGLLSCGYCLSVWVSAIVAVFLPTMFIPNELDIYYHRPPIQLPIIVWVIVNFVLRIFILHRMSNIWHEGVHRWINKEQFVLAFNKYEEQLPRFLGGDDGEPAAGDTGYDSAERNRIEEDAALILPEQCQPSPEDPDGQLRGPESEAGCPGEDE